MKILKYKLCIRVNYGTEGNPKWEDILTDKTIKCASGNLEENEAIARAEAYNGEYTVEDDGQPEEVTIENRVTALEKAVTPGEYIAGKWYYKGDRVSYGGAVYVCIAPDGVVCTWNPDEYPPYWREEE